MDKNDIIEYVMNTPHNTNKAVLNSMLNQLIKDGGDSSDFSTAKLTLINSSGYQTFIYAPTYFDNEFGHSSNYYVYLDGQNEVVLDIILYKGEAIISSEDNVHWFFTDAIGDIEIDSQGSNLASVKGNGTITLAYK